MHQNRLILFFFLALISHEFTIAYAQEGEEPIMFNLELMNEPHTVQKSGVLATFDSTFIYYSDTLQLPFFDEFSKNKIQKYQATPTDPGVTSELYYALLDENDVPYAVGTSFSRMQTFKSTFNVNTGGTTKQNFPGINVKYSNLSRYPVVYETITVFPAYHIYDTVGIVNTPDTIRLTSPDVEQKTARQFFKWVNEPSKLWIDENAYHNYRFAIKPWSLGVMTFDGLDSKGFPYAIGTNSRGYADYLTTKPIDLSGYTLADSLYLSFLYQFEGFGDQPEANDSLIVQFLDVQTGNWHKAWSKNGKPGDGKFHFAHIPIKSAAYLTDAFQFRFVNYGDLSGALDHFHVDYVHFRALSGRQDTLVEDFALVYPTQSLLEKYTSIPWDHYRNNPNGKMNSKMEMVVRNSYLNGGVNISSANGAKVNVFHDNNLEGTITINGQAMVGFNPPTQPIPDYAPRTTYSSVHPITTYNFDVTKPGNHQVFNVQTIANVPVGSNFSGNDTSVVQQVFRNYYAYDDGTAEKAYGTQGIQSRLAVQFDAYEQGEILGVMMHFVPTVTSVTNHLFQLCIWEDENGKPGSIIYEDNSFNLRQPSYGYGRNGFVEYWTEHPVAVPQKYHIGWRQLDAPKLGIGLDKNNDRHQFTSYSIDNGATWTPSEIEGAIMIRPIYSTSMDNEMNVPVVSKENFLAFPNPTNGQVTIDGNFKGGEKFIVRDITGREIQNVNTPIIDLSDSPSGMYFIEVRGSYANTIKVVKK